MRNRRAKTNDIMGGYKYLKSNQIKARLEAFKKRYCKNCKKKEDCDFDTYIICQGKKK